METQSYHRMLELAETHRIFQFNPIFYKQGNWGPEREISLLGVSQQIIPIALTYLVYWEPLTL